MDITLALDPTAFRRKAIADLEDLKERYLELVRSGNQKVDQERIQNLERAARLLPGLLKTEETLLTSVEETEARRRLEESLEPLFAVLSRVLGAEFVSKREEILAALEAELKCNGA